MPKTINYQGWNCFVIKGKYPSDGSTALQLIDAEDGIPVSTATMILPDSNLKEGEVLIKDHSENEGMVECLTSYNIIEATGRYIQGRFVKVPVCNITDPDNYLK